jgi:hypothetical protein
MARPTRPVTHRKLEAWLTAGRVDRSVGAGPTFLAHTGMTLSTLGAALRDKRHAPPDGWNPCRLRRKASSLP